MNKMFLSGFLAGRESVFRYGDTGDDIPGVDDDRLTTVFATRPDRFLMRKLHYVTRVQTSMVVSLLLMVGLFNVQYRPRAEFLIHLDEQDVVVMEEIEQTEQIVKPPPPPRPPVPIEVPNDELLDEEIIELDAEIDFDEPLDLPPPPPAEEDQEPEIFIVVEQMPEIIGGISTLYSVLAYPEIARLAGIEGVVVIRLLIDETGTPSTPVVLRSAGKILDDAAQEALLQLRFKPGMQRGRAVRVQMAFPVTFKLG